MLCWLRVLSVRVAKEMVSHSAPTIMTQQKAFLEAMAWPMCRRVVAPKRREKSRAAAKEG